MPTSHPSHPDRPHTRAGLGVLAAGILLLGPLALGGACAIDYALLTWTTAAWTSPTADRVETARER